MMRVARAALSAFLSMALVVGMAPDCAYARVAAQALHLGASQASLGAAGDVPGAAQDDRAETPAPEVADEADGAGDGPADGAGLQSTAPEEGFSYRQVPGGVEVTGYVGEAADLSVPGELGGSRVVGVADSALSGHASLRSVSLPPTVSRIGGGAFSGCPSLSSVALPEGLRSIGMCAFSGCSLSSVTIPASLETTDAAAIGTGPFARSGLASARLAPGSTRVAAGLFSSCDTLASVELPPTVASVGGRAFLGCSSLASVGLPASLSSVGASAFSGCSSLRSVEVPGSVASVGAGAFSGCPSLSSVTLREGVRSLGVGAFSGCPIESVTIPASLEATDARFMGIGPFARCPLASAALAPGCSSLYPLSP